MISTNNILLERKNDIENYLLKLKLKLKLRIISNKIKITYNKYSMFIRITSLNKTNIFERYILNISLVELTLI